MQARVWHLPRPAKAGGTARHLASQGHSQQLRETLEALPGRRGSFVGSPQIEKQYASMVSSFPGKCEFHEYELISFCFANFSAGQHL